MLGGVTPADYPPLRRPRPVGFTADLLACQRHPSLSYSFVRRVLVGTTSQAPWVDEGRAQRFTNPRSRAYRSAVAVRGGRPQL